MQWGRLALLREEESPVLPGEERNRRRGHGGCRWSPLAERASFSFSGAMGRAGPGGSCPIMNKWGGAWEFLARRGWSGPSPGNLHEPQTFPTSRLPQTLPKRQYSKKVFLGRLLVAGVIHLQYLLWGDKEQQALPIKGSCLFLLLFLRAHLVTRCPA
jgi:hypothetical protein